MARNEYSRELRMRVAKEASLPENKGMEHIIAQKYGIMPWTVEKWRDHYLEYGEHSFYRGYSKGNTKTPRERELEKEVEALRQEVEILKKAAAFLANVKRE
ncbi:MAG: transposase [Firmicutes bacterium]|nr:transposase [Bacillota bacterium]